MQILSKRDNKETSCTKHEQRCDLKYDEIRCLEIEANVNVNNRTTAMCRYCMVSFSKVCNANTTYENLSEKRKL